MLRGERLPAKVKVNGVLVTLTDAGHKTKPRLRMTRSTRADNLERQALLTLNGASAIPPSVEAEGFFAEVL